VNALLHILQHALGRDEYGVQRKNGGADYRNHFCTGTGSDDFRACEQAVTEGLMTRRDPSELSGGDFVYIVTPKGRVYIAEHSPKEPKLSRAAKRYRQWLDEDGPLKFGEWLKKGMST